jgi:hypothetical protein
MKLLELSFKNNDLTSFKEAMQGKQHNTGCSVDVFAAVELCKPFALICGQSKDQVFKVTGAVADAINNYRHRSQNEILGAATNRNERNVWAPPPPAMVSLEKRQQPLDTNSDMSLSSYSQDNTSYERPQKMAKVGENRILHYNKFERGATCILTVPLWVMQRCLHGRDLFCKLSSCLGCA